MPSHQLSMDQLKFKDCAFSVGLRNWGMSFFDFCHLSSQEPKENRQMYPRLKVADAIPSLLLFTKLHWQHLVLCWHSSPLWSPWVKCQPGRAACSTWTCAIPQAGGAALGNSDILHRDVTSQNQLSPCSWWACWLVWLFPYWYINWGTPQVSARHCHLKVTQSTTSLLTCCTHPIWPHIF